MKIKTKSRQKAGQGVHIQKTVTIHIAPEDLYLFWRNFQNFPLFMHSVESVRLLDDRRSRWEVKAPAGQTAEWTAEITEDRPNEAIGWRTVEGSEIHNAGSVTFHPRRDGRGTEVTVKLTYSPPAGKLGDWIAMLFGREPSQQLSQDLRRLKALLETGEVPTNAVRTEMSDEASLDTPGSAS